MALATTALLNMGAQALAGAASYGPPTCPSDTPASCTGLHGHSTGSSCCIQNPGYLLHSQFWWTEPSIGPKDDFTIHGLWYASINHQINQLILTFP